MGFFIVILLIAFLFIILNSLNDSIDKGQWGESRIFNDFENISNWGHKGYTLKNVYVPTNGKTAEIDVIFISKKGIIVVESKNFSGYIFGDEKQSQWTSTLYAGKYSSNSSNKYKFYNPIWQNNAHIKALKQYLGEVKTYSFVVFGNNCELKNVIYDSSKVCVCRERDFRRKIKQNLECLPDVYDDNKLDEIYSRLFPLTIVDEAVKTRHVYEIKKSLNSDICPRCGGKLVLRTAKKGSNVGNKFYGCSNYPKCRYIRDLK